MTPWFKDVKAGDALSPDPFWNKTERKQNHLPPATKVIDVQSATSQTGMLFKVATMSGEERWLDAGWFTGKLQQFSQQQSLLAEG